MIQRNPIGFRQNHDTAVAVPIIEHRSTGFIQDNPVDFIRKNHDKARNGLISKLKSKTQNELIDFAFIEMDAKNQAYFFILENGLLDSFSNYCREKNQIILTT